MVAIPVLIVMDAEDRLRTSAAASAAAAAAGNVAMMGVDPGVGEVLPAGIEIDPSFAAVPLGGGEASAASLMAMATSEDSQFLVRGVVDSAQIDGLGDHGEGPRVFVDPQIAGMTICPGDPALGNAADVRGLVNVGALSRQGLSGDGVAVAIVDTGINLAHLRMRGLSSRLDPHIHWTPTPTIKPGEHLVGHGTMCAYAASIAAPECTLLDFPVLLSTGPGGSVMDSFLSDAVQAFSGLLQMMRKPEEVRPYHSLVVNNSWGMFHESWDFPAGHPGRYGDNPNHPFNLIVGALSRAGADILFAAGNCGSDCPDGRCRGVTQDVITGANSHPEVLSVAGVDVRKRRVGYSSQGPGNANLAKKKPDIAAYTHFHGSDASGVGSADGGTSTACPVAAGCVAALRTKVPPSLVSSEDMRHAIRDTADDLGQNVWNEDIGFGLIDPVAAAGAVAIPA